MSRGYPLFAMDYVFTVPLQFARQEIHHGKYRSRMKMETRRGSYTDPAIFIRESCQAQRCISPSVYPRLLLVVLSLNQ